jgi:hypothetical protein
MFYICFNKELETLKIKIMKKELHWSETGLNQYCTVTSISKDEVTIQNEDLNNYTKFYKVTLRTHPNNPVLFLAKGYELALREVVAFYPNGKSWGGCGYNFAETIREAVNSAIYYI